MDVDPASNHIQIVSGLEIFLITRLNKTSPLIILKGLGVRGKQVEGTSSLV